VELSGIRQIAVIGAGLMGHGIAQVFARKDYSVTLYDLNTSILKTALSQIQSNLEPFIEAGLETKERVEKLLSNIRISVVLGQAVKEADFVIEAAPEDLDLKKDLFEELDHTCSREAILASNTSTLPISEIGKRVKGKERLLITHWFNPPYLIPTVEVVRGESTSQEVMDLSLALLKRIGKRPVKILKDIPGFLVNRVQTAMFREVLSLIERGIAEPEEIDAAIRGSFGLRAAVLGPLATMDLGGLDVLYSGMKYLYPFLDRSTQVQRVFEERIEQGELGLKTGKGFFDYGQKEALAMSGHKRERDRKLLLLLKLLSE
jgi:3-hydroxybutyryl-CoA dehydrogenase